MPVDYEIAGAGGRPQCGFASGVIGAMTAEQLEEAAADRIRRTTRLGLA